MAASNSFETQPPFEEENFPDISEPFAINPNTDFDWESAKTGEESGIDNKIFIDPDSPIENQGTNRDIPLPFPTVAASNLPVSMLPRNSPAVASGVKNMVTSDYGNDIDVVCKIFFLYSLLHRGMADGHLGITLNNYIT
jgi:hypothetical protein